MTEASELPNLSLLIKLLKLTTSPNDQEALAAIRKANEQLLKFGGDWETLLRRHVTIIGSDPFASIPTPPGRQEASYTAGSDPFASVAPKPKPEPQPQKPQAPLLRANTYADYCHGCGVHVKENAGFIKMPSNLSRWLVFCNHCHTHNIPFSFKPARKRTSTAPQPSINDVIGKL